MNKTKKFHCPYCNKPFLRGSMGYTPHMKFFHKREYDMGLQLYPEKPASSWPFIVIHPSPNKDTQIESIYHNPSTIMARMEEQLKLVKDQVNHPTHYTSSPSGIECIDAIESALSPEEFRGFIKGNVIKYSWREKLKGGDEDLKKARWYLSRLVDRLDKLDNEKGDVK